MTGLRFDSEFLKVVASTQHGPPPPPAKTVLDIRTTSEEIIRRVFATIPYPPNVKETVFKVKSYDGAEITVTRFATDAVLASAEPTAAVMHAHGGGLVSCSVEIFRNQIATIAQQAGLPFFAVDWRLAPEYPAPHGVEDCFAALKYVSEHANELNIDPKRIACYGDSAGGCVTAGSVLMARDRGLQPPVAKQVLVYPMLDDRTELPPDAPLNKFLMWTSANNVLAWSAYVGEEKRGKPDADVSPYASPGRAKDLTNLPPTYIDVGSLDLFRNEDMAFASDLAKADVEVELHVWPGLPHGFEGVNTAWVGLAQEGRISSLKRI